MKNAINIQNETQQTQITNQTSFHAIKATILFVIIRRSIIKHPFFQLTLRNHNLIKMFLDSQKNSRI